MALRSAMVLSPKGLFLAKASSGSGMHLLNPKTIAQVWRGEYSIRLGVSRPVLAMRWPKYWSVSRDISPMPWFWKVRPLFSSVALRRPASQAVLWAKSSGSKTTVVPCV